MEILIIILGVALVFLVVELIEDKARRRNAEEIILVMEGLIQIALSLKNKDDCVFILDNARKYLEEFLSVVSAAKKEAGDETLMRLRTLLESYDSEEENVSYD